MATSTITVPVSASMKAYADAQVASGEYPTAGDFVRHLIELDKGALEARLLRALEEEPIELSEEESENGDIFGVALERHRARQNG